MKSAAKKLPLDSRIWCGKCLSGRGFVRTFFLFSVTFVLVGCRSLDGISERFPALSNEQIVSARTPQQFQPTVRAAGMDARPTQNTADASAASSTRTGRIAGSAPATVPGNIVLVSHQDKTQAEPSGVPSRITSAEDEKGVIGLTLQTALSQSLEANPDLVTLRGQVNVNRAVVNVANTYPWNPFVQAQYFPNGRPFLRSPDPGGSAGLSNYYIWAMQRFELAHQRKFRTESALATLSQVEWNIQQAELNNIAQSMRLYFAALYQKELYDLAVETLDLHQKLADVVDRRFRANLAKAADATTTKVALRQAKRQTELARATYQASLLALRQQLNVPMQSEVAFPVKLENFRWNSLMEGVAHAGSLGIATADFSVLADELVEGRPDVMAAQAGVAISEANHRLAKAARVPDISAGPIYETASDNTAYLGMRLQMEIPIFNTGLPLVRQRQAELGQQILTHQQLKIRASLEAQSSLDRFERARKLLIEARAETSAKPRGVSEEVQEMTRQFQGGQADILAVIAVQNSLIQERRAFLDLLNELGQSAAGVIQTTALPVSRVIANVESVPPGQE